MTPNVYPTIVAGHLVPFRQAHPMTAAERAARGMPDPLLEVDDLCRCGHPGYDGHDMRDTPPRCLTAGCYCGLTARCGSTDPHGAHWNSLTGREWCGGNLNVIIGREG